MTYAVVRVRGHIHVRRDAKETLAYLRLNRTNHCVFVAKTPTAEGMLQRAKDYVTWGEVDPTVAAMLLVRRARLPGGKPIDDAYVKANSKYPSVNSLAKALAADEATLADVQGVKPVIRLHPPRGGFEGIKRGYKAGGALGYRGTEINALLQRMLGPEGA